MLEKLRNAVLLVVGGLVAVWGLSTLVGVVQGGPMEPWGPPGSTYKDLFSVEPRTPIWQPEPGNFPIVISGPGSYYLGETINGEEGSNGIEIAADNVTLDLNGFALIGPGKDVGSDNGVYLECPIDGCENTSIHNGTVRDWGGTGVEAQGGGVHIADLRVSDNDFGLLAGPKANVTGVLAQNNDATAIQVYGETLVSDCVSMHNYHGIVADDAIVRNCTASYNNYHGIYVQDNSLIIGNVADHNDQDQNNTGAGIYVESNNNRIEGNNVTNNHTGIDVEGSGNAITNNKADNSVAAGIHVQVGSNSNHIEGNNVLGNAIGIDVDQAGNLIIKNSLRGNTSSHDIIAGNTVGPIYGVADPITGDIPWANFSY